MCSSNPCSVGLGSCSLLSIHRRHAFRKDCDRRVRSGGTHSKIRSTLNLNFFFVPVSFGEWSSFAGVMVREGVREEERECREREGGLGEERARGGFSLTSSSNSDGSTPLWRQSRISSIADPSGSTRSSFP